MEKGMGGHRGEVILLMACHYFVGNDSLIVLRLYADAQTQAARFKHEPCIVCQSNFTKVSKKSEV